MITGYRIEDTILDLQKRPKNIALNTAITRKPFEDQSIKILSILLFIDYYNQNMREID